MNKRQNRRLEIVDKLQHEHPTMEAYDLIQISQYIETGLTAEQLQSDLSQPAGGELPDYQPSLDNSTLEQLRESGATILGPFKKVRARPADPDKGIWCENCQKFHELPDPEEMKAALAAFLEQFRPKPDNDKKPGRDA